MSTLAENTVVLLLQYPLQKESPMFSVGIYAKPLEGLQDKQNSDNPTFVEMTPSKLIEVTNVES